MNPFETETMADLFLRQGHRAEALAIYRRLLHRTAEPIARERIEQRIAAAGALRSAPPASTDGPTNGGNDAIAAQAVAERGRDRGAVNATGEAGRGRDDGDVPLGIPAVRARWSGDVVTVEWNLPPRTAAPRVEILLVKRGPAGVETETRGIDVARETGRVTLTVNGLHLARAAAGYRTNGAFVPVARG